MIRNRLSRRTIKSYEDIHYSCSIRFLDDSESISVVFQKDTLGQWLIDHVCQELNLVEKDYFGLRFVDNEKQRHWLDPLKPVYRQLKNVEPMVLCFRVKFYPADSTKLKEELTRYFLFLQLRRDLHHGRLLCSPQDANLLAAYIIQSEVGDYDPEDHPDGYVSEFKMLPKQSQKQEEKISELHKSFSGQVPSDSESHFLRKASSLETYGVDPHPVKDQKGSSMYLGVTHLGIVTFMGNKRTHLFKWAQLGKIAFEGKMFIVHVAAAEVERDENLQIKKKKHACGFKCPTVAACKHLWKCAVEQQYFFTLNAANEAPKVTSGGGFFTRRSKFRFSGRCQKEVYTESAAINREEPSFTRSPSNPNLVRKRSNLRGSSSLPEDLKGRAMADVLLENGPRDSTEAVVEATPTVLENSLPTEEPVVIADTRYSPASSPTQEALPPIPKPDLVQTQGELDAQIKVLQDELDKCREVGIDVGQNQKSTPPDVTGNTIAKDNTPATWEAPQQNHENKTEDGHIGNNVKLPEKKPDINKPQKTGSVLLKALLYVFVLSVFVFFLLLEIDFNVPVLGDIQKFPEFQGFKQNYYLPFKVNVRQKVGY